MSTHKYHHPFLVSAFMIGSGLSSYTASAQTIATELPDITVRETKVERRGQHSLRTTDTRIGKSKEALRDIPQSITVITERLINDRNLDTVKEALKHTSGISFQAGEGAEEDIRLRGFSLQQTGDLFIDGMRDPAFYDRDTFYLDRIEVLRGSASMLFGRGSTGGAVNQVTKTPHLTDENQVELTLGSHSYRRLTTDFNLSTGLSSALRVNLMHTKADDDGRGNSLDKKGAAISYRWGIGDDHEFLVSYFYLNNNNGINYGMPWIRPSPNSSDRVTLPVNSRQYYGMSSDYNDSTAQHLHLSHLYRFGEDSELRTQIRKGKFERDQRASAIRFTTNTSLDQLSPNTVLRRGTNLKIQDVDTLHVQTDLSHKLTWLGLKHELMAGIDFAKEDKTVYGNRTATQGGIDLNKPNTSVGTPNDGAWINEKSRALGVDNEYDSKGIGIFIQDKIHLTEHWKLVTGARFDRLRGNYVLYHNARNPITETQYYQMKISEWSGRTGLLYQPNDTMSFHASAATSFNTSGDAYSLSAENAQLPPEKSTNLELGAKLDLLNKRLSTRIALFRSTKVHERNTDPDLNITTLSGKRHVTGLELDVMGRITPKWDIYLSYMWMPNAKIDISSATSGEKQGDRPSLTPRHSGSVWSTYQVLPKLRVGAGLTFRGKQQPPRNPGFNADSFVVADAMAEYQFNEKMATKLNISNITDEYYADQLYPAHYVPGAGRLIQLTTSIKF